MTDEAIAASLHDGVRDLTERAKLHSPDPVGQAATLLAAATAIIEGAWGPVSATAVLATLLEPTWADWRDRSGAAH